MAERLRIFARHLLFQPLSTVKVKSMLESLRTKVIHYIGHLYIDNRLRNISNRWSIVLNNDAISILNINLKWAEWVNWKSPTVLDSMSSLWIGIKNSTIKSIPIQFNSSHKSLFICRYEYNEIALSFDSDWDIFDMFMLKFKEVKVRLHIFYCVHIYMLSYQWPNIQVYHKNLSFNIK